MSILDTIRNSLNIGAIATRDASSIHEVSQRLDTLIANSEANQIVEKQKKPKSKLDVRKTDADLAYYSLYNILRDWSNTCGKSIPPYDDPTRDNFLAAIWRDEPIMAGAIYSMTAKMVATSWTVVGRREKAAAAARLFASAAHMDGYDWGGFIASTGSDFYTTNRGVFWETPRIGHYMLGKLAGLGHIDTLMCNLTGNTKSPMVYSSDTSGQTIRFKPGEYAHFTSQQSPRELNLGIGFCAVDRAYRAMRILMGLHDYDEEKLSNLPPEGVAAVTGLTMEEFQDALKLWTVAREADSSLTYPQVLWLIGSQPGTQVSLDFVGFSQMPESFDRQTVVTQYVSTLALCFGVDAREFWPISSGALGTSSESEIQHLKAKGKGPGEFISTIERHLNAELDEETHFGFDTQDIEEDSNAALVAKAWIDAYYPLYAGTPAGKSKASPGGKPNSEMVPSSEEIPESSASGQAMSAAGPMGAPGPEQVIDKDQLLRLLADKGVLPEWMMNDERMMVMDSDIHLSIGKEGNPEDFSKFVWANGVLKEERLAPIILSSTPKVVEVEPIVAELPASTGGNGKVVEAYKMLMHKQEEVFELERNIHGKPIPEQEVTRGSRVTKKTLRDELERWRKHPVLSQYALTTDEEAQLNEAVN